jgi:ATP-dependent RNA helicase RhlB
MRPGGVVTPEEFAKRQAAHAAWSVEQFAVPPMEGKKRFHDFDLPSEVMHGIADLGFQYCTEIQSLSLQNALDGKNIAGKAQTGSGKTPRFSYRFSRAICVRLTLAPAGVDARVRSSSRLRVNL